MRENKGETRSPGSTFPANLKEAGPDHSALYKTNIGWSHGFMSRHKQLREKKTMVLEEPKSEVGTV